MSRRHIITAVLAAFVMLLVVSLPSTEAAVTTSSYTYVVNGLEAPIGLDPLTLKSGMLLPQALLEHMGIATTDMGLGSVAVTRGQEKLVIRLGSKMATRNGDSLLLATAPMVITGQLFLPDDALNHLGVRVTNESGVLLVDAWPLVRESVISAADYEQERRAGAQERTITPTRDALVRVEVVRLNGSLISAPSWTTNSALRGRVQELLKSGLLLQVTVTNTSEAVVSFPAANYYLVDSLGNQYKASGDWVPLMGDLFGNLAPGAKASGVLIYPSLPANAQSFTLYLQTSSKVETIGVYTQ